MLSGVCLRAGAFGRRHCSTLARASIQKDALHCKWKDGSSGRLHISWLRDHCPQSLHPVSGQKTSELRDIIRSGLSPEAVAIANDGHELTLVWPATPSADASATHTSTYDAAWLWRNCGDRQPRCVRDQGMRSSSLAEAGPTATISPASQA